MQKFLEATLAIGHQYQQQKLKFGVNSTGYTVGKTQERVGSSNLSIAVYEVFNNLLYFPHSKSRSTSYWNNCCGYWMPSPSVQSTDYVWRMICDGRISTTKYNGGHAGICPVVMLKSTTKLTKDSNGIWQLSN